MRKHVLRLGLLLPLFLLLSACSPFSAVSELLSPPQFSEENARLQASFEAQFGKNVQYKSPISGAYLSAFLVEDLDGDDGREALVFYASDAVDNLVHIAVFEETQTDWTLMQELDGGGTDVHSVQLTDMDCDGSLELIICYSTNENSRVMSIFSCTSSPFALIKLSENVYTAMLPADLDDNGQTQIFMIHLFPQSGSQSAQARVLQKTQSGITVLDKKYLDGRVSGYGDLFVQRTETGCVLYADAYQGESGMLTEVVVWHSESESMTVPLLDNESRSNTRTVRFSRIPMRDTDGDGVPEIPCQDEVFTAAEIWQNGTKSSTHPYLTRWCAFRDGKLETVCKSLVRSDGSSMFTIPDGWEGRFSIELYTDSGKWNFYQIDPETHSRTGYLFSVIFTTRARWDKEQDRLYVDYAPLQFAGEDMILVYGVNTESTLGLSEEMLRGAFAMLRQ